MQTVELIGNTPMVELRRLNDAPGVRLFAKLEGNNPGGSVKDRAALWMFEKAEGRGLITPGTRLIEATSGNTGIALAMIATMKGYPIDLVMPESATRERVSTMKAFGANVILTPAEGSMEAAIDYARGRVQEGGTFMFDQFSNPDNWLAHVESTGPEIWRDTAGEVTHFVSAMGTTGTIMGCSRYLKGQNPDVQIVGCQPSDGACIPGIRRWPAEYLPAIFEPARVDRVIDVAEDDARETARRLSREEGVSCGVSAGGATWAALQVCRELAEGDGGTVVVILPDRGDRYLSSGLFDD